MEITLNKVKKVQQSPKKYNGAGLVIAREALVATEMNDLFLMNQQVTVTVKMNTVELKENVKNRRDGNVF